MDKTLYICSKNNTTFNFIKFYTIGNKLYSDWGKVGSDKIQTSCKTILEKNVGKSNYISSENQANLELERKVKKLLEMGYSESMDMTHKSIVNSDKITLDNLPKSFCPCKPVSKTSDVILNDPNIIAQRKFNGNCIIITKLLGGTKNVYTRRMELINRLLDIDIINELATQIPEGTMVLNEFVFNNNITKKEDTKIIGSICRTKDNIELINKYNEYKKFGDFTIATFDIMFYNNEFIGNYDYSKRNSILTNIAKTSNLYVPETYEYNEYQRLRNGIAKTDNWEGFVLRYPTGPKSYITYTTNGKADRQGSYKDKFTGDADVIVTGASYGTGKFEKTYAKFNIAQINPETNELIDRGNAGPGKLKHDELYQYTDEIRNGLLKFPFVAEIEFRDIQDSGKYEHAVISRFRFDKKIDECIFEN